MKCLLFHNRNSQLAPVLNTFCSTKSNCNRIWNAAITNGLKADREQHLVINLKTLGMRVFECTSMQRQFKDKMQSKCNSNSITAVNYINTKNNDNNTNKVIAVIKVKQ